MLYFTHRDPRAERENVFILSLRAVLIDNGPLAPPLRRYPSGLATGTTPGVSGGPLRQLAACAARREMRSSRHVHRVPAGHAPTPQNRARVYGKTEDESTEKRGRGTKTEGGVAG